MVRPHADKTLSDLPFSGAGGRGSRSRNPRLIACQCVSLAFRSGGHSQQLAAFCSDAEIMSVAPVTEVSDHGQSSIDGFSVLARTGGLTVDGGKRKVGRRPTSPGAR